MEDAPGLTGSHLRAERGEDWTRLEGLIAQVEKGRLKRLTNDNLLDLPVLYRSAVASLSVAREFALDRDLAAYLEALCTRAHFVLYGVHAPLGQRLRRFFAHDWPAAARALRWETLLAALLLATGAVAAFLMVRAEPSWFAAIVDADLAGPRVPGASPDLLRDTLYDSGGGEGLSTFATLLFVHNSQVSLFTFALGFLFGVPTILLVLYNGCMLGALTAVFAGAGLGGNFAGWLFIHGTTELFAICLASGAGLRIGTAVAFPGRRSRLTAATEAGRVAGTAMAGVVLMLGVAGILEGIGRQTITSDLARFAIGGTMLVAWLLYYYGPLGRARGE